MALKYHPDKNGNTEESKATFQKLQHIYTVLSDSVKRAKYDELGYYKDEDEDDDDDGSFYADDNDSDNIIKMPYDEIQKVLEEVIKQMKMNPTKMEDTIKKNELSMRYEATTTAGDWSVSTIENEIKRIDKLGDIYYVYWTRKGITQLPARVPRGAPKFACVEKLFLDKNAIVSIPSEFLRPLSKLRVLSLEQNKLEVFPEAVLELKELRELNLSYNRIEEVPEGIGKLGNLRVLNLFGNRLRGVPAALCEMESLVELDLDCNDIVEPPPSFRNVRNLILHLPQDVNSALTYSLPPKKKKKIDKKEQKSKKTKSKKTK